MPWLELNPMFQRHDLAHALASGLWTMTDLRARYGISRNNGYKRRERFLASWIAGLAEYSRTLRRWLGETPAVTIVLILAEHARYGWAGQKIL